MRALAVALIAFAAASLPPSAALAYDLSPDFDAWQTTGLQGQGSEGRDLIAFGNEVFVSGSFNASEAIPSANCAVWDGKWKSKPQSDFRGPFVVHQGKLIAGPHRYDGTTVESLESEYFYVYCLASDGATLAALGQYYNPNTTEWSRGLYRWNEGLHQWDLLEGDMASDTVALPQFRALAPWQGGWVVMAEYLDSISGTPVDGVAYWDGAQWSNMGPAETDLGHALTVYQGQLLMGSRSGIFAWNGSNWESWAPTAYHQDVRTLLVDGDDLYAGGDFLQIDTIGANRIARFDGFQWHALGNGVGTPTSIGTSVLSIAVAGQAVYATGQFFTAGDEAALNLARWNGTKWQHMGLGGLALGADGFALYENDVVAVGPFTSWGSLPMPRVAALESDVWKSLGPGLGSDDPFGVTAHAAVEFDGDLVVVGNFDVSGTDPITRVARWNGSAWSSMASEVNGEPFTLALANGDLYVGGSLYSIDGVAVTHVARWDGESWHAVGGTLLPTVYALAEFEGDLVIGGSFLFAEGQYVNHVARWNGAQWSPMGSGIGTTVRTLEVHDGALYAGGEFAGSGHVVAWDGAQWNPLGSGVNGPVDDIQGWGGLVWVVGEFDQAGNVAQAGIATWDPDQQSWVDPGFDLQRPNLSQPGTGHALFARGSALYMSGSFTALQRTDGSTVSSVGIARITDPVTAAPPLPPRADTNLHVSAHPNPFNPRVEIAFELSRSEAVRATVFDVRGRRVVDLVDGVQTEGEHMLQWSGLDAAGRPVGSGVYFVHVQTADQSETRKLVLAK